jgi:hypothetical protein
MRIDSVTTRRLKITASSTARTPGKQQKTTKRISDSQRFTVRTSIADKSNDLRRELYVISDDILSPILLTVNVTFAVTTTIVSTNVHHLGTELYY